MFFIMGKLNEIERGNKLLAGTNFSVLVVCCIWQVLILAFKKIITVVFFY